MTTAVRDSRPPLALVRVLNPVLRAVLRTPVGRLAGALALLEFTGRRSGRRYRVPVLWHHAGGEPVVFTPAPWRANFAGGTRVVVHHQGRAEVRHGTLVTDPDEVRRSLQAMVDRGESLRWVGIEVPLGQRLTREDVVAVDRAEIRFGP